jgi:hypothetical protein
LSTLLNNKGKRARSKRDSENTGVSEKANEQDSKKGKDCRIKRKRLEGVRESMRARERKSEISG